MPWQIVYCLPVNVKVGFDFEALAFEGGHIIGFGSMLLVLVSTQVHLPPQLLHPNMRFPPAIAKTTIQTLQGQFLLSVAALPPLLSMDVLHGPSISMVYLLA